MKRYDFEPDTSFSRANMVESADGEYVLYSDYGKLLETTQEILKQLHGARHGNIHSPDDLCVANCPQCAEFFGGPEFVSSVLI